MSSKTVWSIFGKEFTVQNREIKDPKIHDIKAVKEKGFWYFCAF